ncbi:hypothetical protein TNCT_129271 [Trichonephila clavata]|uniref:Uncharacterized protein n=1 Tax=Trichonephila clavata TaxID=2740835 RepID=A0A8X6L470_TRICU|nr:hypothetical protein TNCT_129271 [Trichonephila clavata]
MGGVNGIWPPSRHEVPGLNDGVEFPTRSAQERVFDGAKDILFVSIGGGKTIFSLVVIIFFGYTDSFQFHRGPARPEFHTFLTCQVEPPEDSSKLDGGKIPITCCRARSKAEAKEDFSI